MSTTFRRFAPEQSLLLPPPVREWLPEGQLAHNVSNLMRIPTKSITYSDGNRSPVGASDAGPGIMSPGSLGSCRRSGYRMDSPFMSSLSGRVNGH